MTYLLEANKTPELSWASRHTSRLRFSRRMRCWGEKEKDISLPLCKLLLACLAPVKLDNAVPWESNRCCKCQRPAMVAWGQNMSLSVVLLSAGQRLRQLMPSPGVRANIYRGFILYSLLIHSMPMIHPNLGGVVNQENLSVLAASVWTTCMIRRKGLSKSGRYVSMSFCKYQIYSFRACN